MDCCLRVFHSLASVVCSVLIFGAFGCGRPAPAEILQLDDLEPRRIEVGDRVVITGQNFPSPVDVRRVSVTFRGMLVRPGRAPCRAPVEVVITDPPEGEVITDPATGQVRERSYSESTTRVIRLDGRGRVEFTVTEGLLSALTRCPDERAGGMNVHHATLWLGSGAARTVPLGVTVTFEGLGGVRAVSGTLRGIAMELQAPAARRLALETDARARAERVLDFLGITLAASHPLEGGLRVASVRVGSPADRAGIAPNDVLTRLDGLTILGVQDFLPAPGVKTATLSVLRGDIQDDHVVSLDGLTPSVPFDWVASVIVVVVAASMLTGLLYFRGGLLSWVSFRVRAGVRAGGCGVVPFVRWLIERVRTLAASGRTIDESIASDGNGGGDRCDGSERDGSGAIDWIAPYLVPAMVVSTVVAVPFGSWLCTTGLDVGALYALAAVARMLSSLLAGERDRGRGWSPVAGVRAALGWWPSVLSALAAMGCVVATVGSLSVRGIVAFQGGYPWEWLLFRTPVMPVVFVLYALGVFGTVRSAGAVVRSTSGGRGLVFRLREGWVVAEWINVFVMCVIGTVLFLGGWQLPGVSLSEQSSSTFLSMAGVSVFMVKTWVCVLLVVWVRWALPDVNFSELVRTCWRSVGVLVLASAVVTGGWLVLVSRVDPVVVWAVGLGTFVLTVTVLLWLVVRPVVQRWQSGVRAYVPDPFPSGFCGIVAGGGGHGSLVRHRGDAQEIGPFVPGRLPSQ